MIRHGGVLLVALVTGCDVDAAGSLDDSGAGTTDSGASPTGQDATQVGSEGFWGCPVDRLEPVSPTEPLPDLGVPEDLAAGALGAWSLGFVARTDGSTTAGAASLTATSWSLAHSRSPCADHLVVGVAGSIERGGVPVAISGWLGLRPGNATSLLTADGGADEVAAAWGLPAPPGLPGFRWSLEASEGSLAGVAAFAACGPTEVACDAVAEVLDVTGAR